MSLRWHINELDSDGTADSERVGTVSWFNSVGVIFATGAYWYCDCDWVLDWDWDWYCDCDCDWEHSGLQQVPWSAIPYYYALLIWQRAVDNKVISDQRTGMLWHARRCCNFHGIRCIVAWSSSETIHTITNGITKANKWNGLLTEQITFLAQSAVTWISLYA